jgi:hypothetical protein
MEQAFVAGKRLGHAQAAAGTFDTAKTLAAAGITVPAATTLILVTPETQAVRWRDDGTAPTVAVGYPLPAGSELRYSANGATSLQFIAQVAGAVMNFAFYG